ncbi:MAG TPA: carotenoid biosynthesis protein [Sediminibacterium sp.]|nr:carotenoid biosynthesis protein [Sediminibacterium sp.]
MLTKKNISIYLAILFHLSGLIGILYTPYKEWFIGNTPLNLLLMTVLLVWNQQKPNRNFFYFILICFTVGMITEIIGVKTGILFGNYSYGAVLGMKWMGVPLLIGVNWFVIVFCCMVFMEKLHHWVKAKYLAEHMSPPHVTLETLSVIVDGAILATAFDWLMEPIAMKLDFWQWEGQDIPALNYACWFLTSCALIAVSRKLSFHKYNPFAVHLLVIQTFFFLTLRIFLT